MSSANLQVEELEELLLQKSVLLHEVNHRAKNSITMAISFLRLQKRQHGASEVAEILEEAIQRLMHVARVHDILARRQGEQQTIEMAAYLRDLCLDLSALRCDNVRIELVAEPMELDGGAALNIALIIQEAISNALKHAFPDGRDGVVRVQLRRMNDNCVALVIEDNGVGLQTKRRNGSIGMRLMSEMARALGGVLTIDCDEGTRISAQFPPHAHEGCSVAGEREQRRRSAPAGPVRSSVGGV